MALQNAPTPSLIYPKSGALYLLSKVQELTANVTDLIQTLAQKDQQLAELEGMLNDAEVLRKRIGELEAQGQMPPEHRGNGAALTT